jgi:excisionase family DNA binding protein
MTISPGQPLLVPIPDAAARLGGLSRTTIYALVHQGQLVRVSVGRRSFITSASLEGYVDRLAEGATA